MYRNVEFIIDSLISKTAITGAVPNYCTDRLPYAEAERIVADEGIIISQYHSHYLFFLEVIELDLHQDLEASYLLKEDSLFLFLMLEGSITFSKTTDQPIREATGGNCYATYNSKGTYKFCIPAGKHRICYLSPRKEWIDKNIVNYPHVQGFLARMQQTGADIGHLPHCRLMGEIEKALNNLFQVPFVEGKDIEVELMYCAKQLLNAYQAFLNRKYGEPAYLVRDYIDKHYDDPELDNKKLMNLFHITEKTLIAGFKREFGTTPNHYLIEVRMSHAAVLLKKGEMKPSVVSSLVGYDKFRSFKAQFVKIYGIIPSLYHQNEDKKKS